MVYPKMKRRIKIRGDFEPMRFTHPIEMQRATHYGNEYYKVYSAKLGRVVQLFSKLEYFNYLSLETDPNVETFCEQPLQIQIVEDDKVKHAIFDMWVQYKDGREELQEVKYSKELTDETASAIRSQEQIRRQKLWCEDNGIAFTVRTEKDLIQGEYMIPNRSVIAGLLRRYTPTDADHYSKLVIRCIEDAYYDRRKKVLVNELISKELLPIGNEWEHLAYMYINKMINLNIAHKPLDLRTEVRLYAEAD